MVKSCFLCVAVLFSNLEVELLPQEYQDYAVYVFSPDLDYFLTGKSH